MSREKKFQLNFLPFPLPKWLFFPTTWGHMATFLIWGSNPKLGLLTTLQRKSILGALKVEIDFNFFQDSRNMLRMCFFFAKNGISFGQVLEQFNNPSLGFEPQIRKVAMCPQVVGENSHFGRGKGKNLSWNFFSLDMTYIKDTFCKKRGRKRPFVSSELA